MINKSIFVLQRFFQRILQDRITHNSLEHCKFSLTAKVQSTNTRIRRADGRTRSVNTYNGMMPGPLMIVCQERLLI